MKKEKIILVGGGGHCKSCIDVIEATGKYIIAGIVEKEAKIGTEILDYPVIGCDDDLPELVNDSTSFLITVGQIKSPAIRIKLYDTLKRLGAKLPVIISPLAHVSNHAKIGEGTIVMHQALVNADATVGVNCIINTKALVEHDSTIGNNCHISTASVINGECVVNDNCFIGSNSVLINNIKIGADAIIGSGSNIVRDITESGTYIGLSTKK